MAEMDGDTVAKGGREKARPKLWVYRKERFSFRGCANRIIETTPFWLNERISSFALE